MLDCVRECQGRASGEGHLPAISSMVLRVRFSCSPLHSRALMPNNEVKKDNGRKLAGCQHH